MIIELLPKFNIRLPSAKILIINEINCNFIRYLKVKLVHGIIFWCFVCLGLKAQVNAPDLRCLSVGASGNVTLTWLKPADPQNKFVEYEIHHSTSASGPFVKIATLPVYNLTSYTHIGPNANSQSQYYFMKTKFSPASFSANSDTLRSLYINVSVSSNSIATLNYNLLATPQLPSSAFTYTISRQKEAASFNTIKITNTISYNDTIFKCKKTLYNYQVALSDASGCISQSNIKGDSLFAKPKTQKIDTVSVLPNGQVLLGWTPSLSPDCSGYTIYQLIKGIKTQIAFVPGINNTTYTFTSVTAKDSIVTFYIASNDSCNNISPISDDSYSSMLLTANYNVCARQTQLSWNAYGNLKGGILRYEIMASNGGPFLKIETTTFTSFVHQTGAGNVQWRYFIRVINTSETLTASSSLESIMAYEPPASAFVYIKSASVNTDKTITIRLLIDTLKPSRAIQLDRSEDGINFNTITTIGTSPLQPDYTFNDEKLDVKKQIYYYKATVLDSCNNGRFTSRAFKTFTLSVKNDREDKFIQYLNWSAPSGFEAGIVGYNIYRVLNENYQIATPIAFVNSTILDYTDNTEDAAREGGKLIYFIEANESLGNIYGVINETAKCNINEAYIESDIFIPNAFTPRGKNPIWLPITHFVEKTDYKVQVYSRWGNKVFETTDDQKGWDGANCEDGIYAYLIQYKSSRGEYIERKGTVALLKSP